MVSTTIAPCLNCTIILMIIPPLHVRTFAVHCVWHFFTWKKHKISNLFPVKVFLQCIVLLFTAKVDQSTDCKGYRNPAFLFSSNNFVLLSRSGGWLSVEQFTTLLGLVWWWCTIVWWWCTSALPRCTTTPDLTFGPPDLRGIAPLLILASLHSS